MRSSVLSQKLMDPRSRLLLAHRRLRRSAERASNSPLPSRRAAVLMFTRPHFDLGCCPQPFARLGLRSQAQHANLRSSKTS